MRPLQFAFICFLLLMIVQSCKPKDGTTGKNIFNKNSDSTEINQTEQNKLTPQEMLTRKWRVTGTIPVATPEDAEEMRNSILEFTKEGKLFVTSKGQREEAATVNFSFDNKYLLSTESGHGDRVDSLLIQELTVNRMVLVSIKENRTLIAEPVK